METRVRFLQHLVSEQNHIIRRPAILLSQGAQGLREPPRIHPHQGWWLSEPGSLCLWDTVPHPLQVRLCEGGPRTPAVHLPVTAL